MRHLATVGGHAHRMVRAVKKLREEFAKPLRIGDVAKEIGMSVSGFHAHFKAVTAMSPLQFQKQLRLQETRRLMLTESLDAGEDGFQVGCKRCLPECHSLAIDNSLVALLFDEFPYDGLDFNRALDRSAFEIDPAFVESVQHPNP